ncbi:NAD(P)H-dependent oxidoreductase [Streptomyces sp. PSKA54]|uniref:NAD(P)H-dependent oxidoreductase n=1 Tax=Streptomyces himalayensis subsp. aureolus TaxID=2758039 RepID=A0A7W2HJH2_9ACTN|nr:NAD(P)H-dependent oxidoreductase [Streptomyces himalayensis]MBA4866145.1 NAD(P)H-dependent oxidoreductase [Streptomyces himalayensis subsp. aureolus]
MMNPSNSSPASATSSSTHTPLRVAVLTGSTREGRFGPVVTDWFLRFAEQRGDLTLDAIDLAEHPLPDVTGIEPPADPVLDALTPRLAAADAFVVITPEYNHSFPAPLKNAIDLHFTQWQAKPVGFVSYGGLGGGLRAVEQLRLVFAELHAVTVRDTVSFHMAWENFAEDGSLLRPDIPEGAAKGMLDQIGWWGRTLRAGRADAPYSAR